MLAPEWIGLVLLMPFEDFTKISGEILVRCEFLPYPIENKGLI
jgi:hypothetical protein